MKIITCATNKGGEGKTTTTINLAEYFSIIKKKRVLCIDLDPQANLSNRYLDMDVDPDYETGKLPPIHDDLKNEEINTSSIADVFFGENICPYETDFTNLEIMPSHSEKLEKIENSTNPDILEKIQDNFKLFLEMPELKEHYDIVLIDTPPAKGPLTKSAIRASTHLIIPAQMEKFSVEGIYGMLHLFRKESYLREEGNELKLIGVLPNQVRKVTLHNDFMKELKSLLKDDLIPYTVHKRTAYSEILAENANPRSVFEFSRKKKERLEMEEVCNHCANIIFS